MPPQNHSHLSTRPEVRRPSRPQIRTAVLECREAWSSQSPDTVLAFDKRPHERPQPSKAPRPPNMQGRFFAVCFRSLFCNADDGEGRTLCFDEGLPASTTGACDALKDSHPEAVRRLPAHTAGRYRVSRMSLGRWATAISSLPLSLSGVHPIGWTQVRPSGGAASRWTGRLLDIVELSAPHSITSSARPVTNTLGPSQGADVGCRAWKCRRRNPRHGPCRHPRPTHRR